MQGCIIQLKNLKLMLSKWVIFRAGRLNRKMLSGKRWGKKDRDNRTEYT